MSAHAYLAKYPTGNIPRNSKDFGKTFICRRGCNTRTATYTAEFIWEDIFRGTDEDVANLIQRVQNETKATRRKREDRPFSDEVEDFLAGDDQDDTYRTPKKKRKTSRVSTPSK